MNIDHTMMCVWCCSRRVDWEQLVLLNHAHTNISGAYSCLFLRKQQHSCGFLIDHSSSPFSLCSLILLYKPKQVFHIVVWLSFCFRCVCVCQNPTLDQVSLCTPGRLNDVAPRPAPPALEADSPDPEAPLTFPSPSSLLSLSSSSDPYPAWRALCFIWPAGLLHSSAATTPSMPPQLWHQLTTEIQFHHTKSYHQHVLRETAASNWPCFSSWRWRVFSSPRCCQACNTVLQFALSSNRKQKSTMRWQWG